MGETPSRDATVQFYENERTWGFVGDRRPPPPQGLHAGPGGLCFCRGRLCRPHLPLPQGPCALGTRAGRPGRLAPSQRLSKVRPRPTPSRESGVCEGFPALGDPESCCHPSNPGPLAPCRPPLWLSPLHVHCPPLGPPRWECGGKGTVAAVPHCPQLRVFPVASVLKMFRGLKSIFFLTSRHALLL